MQPRILGHSAHPTLRKLAKVEARAYLRIPWTPSQVIVESFYSRLGNAREEHQCGRGRKLARPHAHTHSLSIGALAAIVCLLGACASHTWAPGPGLTAADFGPDNARCSLMARHSGGGLMPYRSPAFVANASLSYAIGNAVRRQQDFNNCMAASGAVPTDATQGSPAAPGASGVSAAARFDEAHWGPTVPGRRRPRDGGGQSCWRPTGRPCRLSS